KVTLEDYSWNEEKTSLDHLLRERNKLKWEYKRAEGEGATELKVKLDESYEKISNLLNVNLYREFREKKIQISREEFLRLNPFHWGFEFYDAFDLDKPKEERGFDVVIGNPPWGEILSKLEKRIIDNTFFSKRYLYNIFTFFIEASIKILKNKAKFGYILPKNMIRSNAYSKIREIILSNFRIIKLTAVGIGVFVGVTSEASIIITEKNTMEEELKTNYILCSSVGFYEFPPKKENKIKQEILYSLYDYIFNIFLTDDRIEILKYIKKRSKNLEELTHPLVGISAGDEKNLTYFSKKSELWKPVVRGDDVSRYGVDYKGEFVLYDRDVLHRAREEDKFLSKEKLLSQHVSNSLKFGYDARQLYCMQTINLFVPKNNSYSLKCLLTILNSALMNFFYQRLYNIGSEFTTAISLINLRRLPIKLPKNQKSFESLCNYLLFLNETLECRELEKKLIEFIDTQVIDSLVYELYFREKFEEEGLKTNLLGLVEPYLGDIEGLKSGEEKLKVIKEVVAGIENDRAIKEQI
ncbi:MAG: N-6 DNA methylase, partial [Methanophagales archaeon]|nr:N-6 DNA methylase [Methanophagales archaeon]